MVLLANFPYIEFVNLSFIWSYFDFTINVMQESRIKRHRRIPMNVLKGGEQDKAKKPWIEGVQEIPILNALDEKQKDKTVLVWMMCRLILLKTK